MPQRADDIEVKLRQTCRELEEEKVCYFAGLLCTGLESITLIFHWADDVDLKAELMS